MGLFSLQKMLLIFPIIKKSAQGNRSVQIFIYLFAKYAALPCS